jgi:hypothetical protein
MSEETAIVSFQVLGIDIVRGRGRLLGLAATVGWNAVTCLSALGWPLASIRGAPH